MLIHPDLDTHTFSGHVEIALEATAASSAIVLHAHELAIQKASFAAAVGADGTPCEVGAFEKEEQSVTITLAAPMAAGEKGVLSLDFTGVLNDQVNPNPIPNPDPNPNPDPDPNPDPNPNPNPAPTPNPNPHPNLNDQLAGFYRTKYTSSAGEERFGAVTQFEATDARHEP